MFNKYNALQWFLYNLGVNSQVQKQTKFAFLAHQATCKKSKWEALLSVSFHVCARGTWYVLDIELDKNKNMFLEWE